MSSGHAIRSTAPTRSVKATSQAIRPSCHRCSTCLPSLIRRDSLDVVDAVVVLVAGRDNAAEGEDGGEHDGGEAAAPEPDAPLYCARAFRRFPLGGDTELLHSRSANAIGEVPALVAGIL